MKIVVGVEVSEDKRLKTKVCSRHQLLERSEQMNTKLDEIIDKLQCATERFSEIIDKLQDCTKRPMDK